MPMLGFCPGLMGQAEAGRVLAGLPWSPGASEPGPLWLLGHSVPGSLPPRPLTTPSRRSRASHDLGTWPFQELLLVHGRNSG